MPGRQDICLQRGALLRVEETVTLVLQVGVVWLTEMKLRHPKTSLAGRTLLVFSFCGKVVSIPMYYERGALFIFTFKKLWRNSKYSESR